ncbi:MAG: hypothetical protein J2P45_17670 [Candidatus Dormibacteraeota bacterium]|nr:hypothetical protein [Candidatus Dormibacteraeota bacterium]
MEQRLREAQPELEVEQLERVVTEVLADPWAKEVALGWAGSGAMPAEPEVEGLNPAALMAHFKPSVVLSALPQMLREPEVVLETFRHPLPGWRL